MRAIAGIYEILAEAFIRQERFRDALEAIQRISEEVDKEVLLREVRNGTVKLGDIETFQETSRRLGLSGSDVSDLSMMLIANVERERLNEMIEIIDLLPEDETKEELINSAIVGSAFRGRIDFCERLAVARNRDLTKREAMLARIVSIRKGDLVSAKRAAEIINEPLTKEDYTIMFVANKDLGNLDETVEAAKRAGITLTEDILVALLLASMSCGKADIWRIAEIVRP